jgi:small GTP-binding protein
MIMSVPVFKVLLVGDSNVGKSSLIRRMLLGEFDEEYNTTIGVDLSAVIVDGTSAGRVVLTVIDLGGQKEFSDLRAQYYHDANYAVLVYDITDGASFNALPGWFDSMKSRLVLNDGVEFRGIVLGNKADMTQERQVSQQSGKSYADSIGWMFLETSAKSGLNVESMFLEIANQLVLRTNNDTS